MSRLPTKLAMRSAILALALCTVSACNRPEPPRTVSDTCLTMKVVRFQPAPAAGADDQGNQFDTDETVKDLIAQNAAWRAICEEKRQ